MSIVTRFFPNGEFTKGVDTSKRRKSRPERISDQLTDTSNSPNDISALSADMTAHIRETRVKPGQEFMSASECRYTYICAHMGEHHWGVEDSQGYAYMTSTDELPERWLYQRGASPLIGSSDGRIFTQTPPSRKKCLTMTKSMGRNIRNAGYLLQQQYGKDNLSFLTLTLPDLSPEGLAACAANWGRMVDQFLKWLRTKCEKKGFDLTYVYCTEIQLKRLQTRGEYAPHLHLLFRGKISRRAPWAITPTQARKAWVRCIKSVCSESFNASALENLQRIKSSASGYLSKYLSKGTPDSGRPDNQEDGTRMRGHWGGMDRSLNRRIKRATQVLKSDGSAATFVRSLFRRMGALIERNLVRFYAEGIVYTGASQEQDKHFGLLVGVGCLRMPTYEGGLVPVYEYLLAIGECDECDELLLTP